MKNTTKIILLIISVNLFFRMSSDNGQIKFKIDKQFLLGKYSPANISYFAKVDKKYINVDKSIYLLKPVYKAYQQMYDSALKEGIKLNIISGYRSWWHQKAIWENKWNGNTLVEGRNLSKENLNDTVKALEILNYSSMPGISRHHWGTDLDLLEIEDSLFTQGNAKDGYKWLVNNANKFGFCQTYTVIDSIRPTGFKEEKWHWSFFPISEKLLIRYQDYIKYSDISGFDGSNTAIPLRVIENYVFSINQDCK